MPIDKDIYARLKRLIAHYTSDNVTRFAAAIGQKPNTFLDYLKPDGQHKIKISMIYDILEKFPEVNPKWLLLGEGDMVGANEASAIIPPEELNEKLTPEQRNMMTSQRIMKENGASPERIVAVVEAIILGKAAKSTYTTAESPANPGYNNVHEPGPDWDNI